MVYPYWENASESQGKSQVGCKMGLQREFLFKRRINVILNIVGKSTCATQSLLFVQWRWCVQDVLRTAEPWCVLWWLNHHNVYSRPTTWCIEVNHLGVACSVKAFSNSACASDFYEKYIPRSRTVQMRDWKIVAYGKCNQASQIQDRSGGALPVCRVVCVPSIIALDHLPLCLTLLPCLCLDCCPSVCLIALQQSRKETQLEYVAQSLCTLQQYVSGYKISL